MIRREKTHGESGTNRVSTVVFLVQFIYLLSLALQHSCQFHRLRP